jgi:hypothetical protein
MTLGMLQRGIRIVEWKNIHNNILEEYLAFHKLYMGSPAATGMQNSDESPFI